MLRIYFYKRDALVVNERLREFYFTSTETADRIDKEIVMSIQPKYSLHNQADLLLELGYRKIVMRNTGSD